MRGREEREKGREGGGTEERKRWGKKTHQC